MTMNLREIISERNWTLINNLNDSMEKVGIKNKIKITLIDSSTKFGISLSIPSIFSEKAESFELEIAEDIKTSNLSFLQIIDSINKDLEELFTLLTPEYNKLIRIREAFKETGTPKDNTNVIKYNITITTNDTKNRHGRQNN